jgi:hypothetical protein
MCWAMLSSSARESSQATGMSEINYLNVKVFNCLQGSGMWYGDLSGGKRSGLQDRAQLKQVSAVCIIWVVTFVQRH